MIPISDNIIKRQRIHPVTWGLITLNIFIFIYEIAIPAPSLTTLLNNLGLSSENVTFWHTLSFQFLHAGWFHLIGNMIYLWVFGNTVEDKAGSLKFILIYLISGAVGGVAQALLISDGVPIVGASASIAGLLGVYIIWFPYARIKTLLPIMIFWTVVTIPALFVLVIWFFTNLLNSFATITNNATDNVAYIGHVCGFLIGIVIAWIIIKQQQYFDKR